MNYALDDVRYLHALCEELQGRLDERERRLWLDEEMRFYYQVETYERDPQRLWLRVSRHRSLSPRGLAVLRELEAWREGEAQNRNTPRARVVQDDVLIDISRRMPTHPDQLKVLRRLHPREIARSADEILDAVERGRNCPEKELPRLPQIREDDPELNVTVDLLATFVKMRARESRIATSYLATKKDLMEFANAHRNGHVSQPARLKLGWRHDLVGRELERFLDGKLALAVDPRKTRLRLISLGEDEGAS
jgi:ribonuclease D